MKRADAWQDIDDGRGVYEDLQVACGYAMAYGMLLADEKPPLATEPLGHMEEHPKVFVIAPKDEGGDQTETTLIIDGNYYGWRFQLRPDGVGVEIFCRGSWERDVLILALERAAEEIRRGKG